jgi:hypothetical protein
MLEAAPLQPRHEMKRPQNHTLTEHTHTNVQAIQQTLRSIQARPYLSSHFMMFVRETARSHDIFPI